MYGAAVAIVVLLLLHRSRQVGLARDLMLPAIATGAVCGIAGTRLFHLVTTGRILQMHPAEWFGVSGSGSWGAYFGATFGVLAYFLVVRQNPWPALDVAGSAAGFGTCLGRLGCLLAGCDFGRITSVPWAVHYPAGSLAFRAHVASGAIAPDATQSLAVHPLTIYLSLNGLLVFLVVSAIWRRWRQVPGVTIAAFWILYGATRFFWEFLRDPAAGGAVTGISLSQQMALVSVGIGVAIAFGVSRKRAHPAPMSAPEPAA